MLSLNLRFLAGAAGNFIGSTIGGAFGGGAEGLSDSAFMAADAAQLAEQGLSAGAIGQNMGAAAGNWGAEGIASGLGELSSSTGSGFGEISTGSTIPDSDWGNMVGQDGGSIQGLGASEWEIANSSSLDSTGPMQIGIEHAPFESSMGAETAGGYQGNGVTTWGQGNAYENPLADTVQQTPPTLAEITSTANNPVGEMNYNNRVGDYTTSAIPDGFENPQGQVGYANTAPATAAAAAQPATLKSMFSNSGLNKVPGNIGKWFGDTDASLAKYGMPKGTALAGMVGIGSYLTDQYEIHKAEQIAKGMKPMTLEEYRNSYFDKQGYMTAANKMGAAGRTGTLPKLLADMNSKAQASYNTSYLPQAQQGQWDRQVSLGQANRNSYGNLINPLASMWAMNKVK